jgi:riboflavin kinase/FMN adenylyltransferase
MDLGEQHGFAVYGVPEIRHEGSVVSSTRIREAVRAADFEMAKALLGRDYTVLGEVVHGRHLGRQLGFPTANVALENEELPPNGVYAVRATVDGTSGVLKGVANLGTRPTVDERATDRSLEAHLFDFDGDLYGRVMEITFVRRLRDERKFAGLDELKAQIAADVIAARKA